MNLNDIKELIEKIDSSNIAYFEVKVNNSYIKMDKSLTRSLKEENKISNEDVSKTLEAKEVDNEESLVSSKKSKEVSEEVKEEVKEEMKKVVSEEDLYVVTSPMVGTFYESPGVGEPSYVSVGSKISFGDILCIIEAMKLMNEIESEIAGEIVEVLVQNGNMVEYGQPLFKVRRA